MKDAEVIEQLRAEITDHKHSGRDYSHLALRLRDLERKPKPNKTPRVNTP
jgi:TfoX/Sxy family transcriptional regulator of competence genes